MLAQPFALTNVMLLDGPFREAMLRDKAYLLSLDPNRFLYNFRVNYGLATSVTPYGGWDSPGSEQRGCVVGHYLTACSQMYASTGDPQLKARVDFIVAQWAQCQALATNAGFHAGYLSGFPESHIDRVVNLQPVWAPWYAIHKIMAGLLDAYQWCHNAQALAVLKNEAGWVQYRIDQLTTNQVQAMLDNEFGGMGEVLANLYAVTGNPDHLRLARAFDHARLFDPLAADIDPLDGYHANTQIPKMIAAAREYELTGDSRYHEIATFFWQRVAQHRSFVIGGHGDHEFFFPIADFPRHLSAETCETCNTYNMLKLTRHLFAWQPDAVTMDFYERALFNHILASQEPEQGMFTYLVSLKPGHFKTYSTPENSFWCCVGTGMENHSKYGDTIFFHGTNSLYVNLFIAAQLSWPEQGVMLRQDTSFPESNLTRLTWQCAGPVALDLKIRQPAWATTGLRVTVNGAAQNLPNGPGTYATLSRVWQNGDVVDIELPMTLHTEPLPQDTNTVAFLYGPIVLAGELGTAGMPGSDFAGGQLDYVGVADPLVPVLVGDDATLLNHITPAAGEPLAFQTHGLGQPQDVTLIPFYRLHHQRYSVYWHRYMPAAWTQQAAQIAADEARLVDQVVIGDAASETAHDRQSQNSNTGNAFGLNWRDANNGGWFSYRLAVRPNEAVQLVVKYWGSDTGGRVFDILVDGQNLATQTLDNNQPGQLFDVAYSVPPEWTSGKTNVTVQFQAHSGLMAGGIFGLRLQTTFDPGALMTLSLNVTPHPAPDVRQSAQALATYQNLADHPVPGSPWLVFTSSDTNVFTVSTNGVIQPVRGGTATLTAKYLGLTASRPVTVTNRPPPAPRHRYSFNAANVVNGTNVVDAWHPDEAMWRAVLRGQAVISDGQLVLNGATGTFVELPSGLFNGYDAVTVEAWAAFDNSPVWSYLFAFGDTLGSGQGAGGFWFTPHSGFGDHRLILSDVPGDEWLVTRSGVLDNQGLKHIVAVIDPDYGYEALYLDGVLVNERNDVPFGMNALTNAHSYLGKSTFAWDPFMVGRIREVRLYQGRWSAADVSASFAAGPARVPVQLHTAADAASQRCVLSWVPADTNVLLQWATNLGPTTAWVDLALTPVVSNEQCVVTLPLTNAAMFFRLKL